MCVCVGVSEKKSELVGKRERESLSLAHSKSENTRKGS